VANLKEQVDMDHAIARLFPLLLRLLSCTSDLGRTDPYERRREVTA
jgi:hypothetical protein